MSVPSDNILNEMFRAQFGAPPGSLDAKVECENWRRMCGKLLADLERTRVEIIFRDMGPVPSMEEIYAQVDREQTMDELIAELKRSAEKPA